jgi:hypothetical protein
MKRTVLRDDQWERIKDLLPGKAGDCGVTVANNRQFIEAVMDCSNGVTLARLAGILRELA